jgi:hypothetical protein
MVGGTAFLFKNSRDSLSRTSLWDHPIAQTPVQGAIFTANAVIGLCPRSFEPNGLT